MLASIPIPACQALQLYLNQTSRRSLRRLAEDCAQHDIKASLPTLKRWSVRYNWQQHVVDHDRAVAEKSMAITVDYQAQAMTAYFNLIDAAKNRYEWLIDPNNPNVTPKQRRRATNMTLSDYLRVLKMEIEAMKLLKTPSTARAVEPESRMTAYTGEEVQIMTAALAEYRHHLPPGSLTKLQ